MRGDPRNEPVKQALPEGNRVAKRNKKGNEGNPLSSAKKTL
jgi:hypothetical protein